MGLSLCDARAAAKDRTLWRNFDVVDLSPIGDEKDK